MAADFSGERQIQRDLMKSKKGRRTPEILETHKNT